MVSDPVVLDGGAMAVDEVVDVARGRRPVVIGDGARAAIEAAREVVDRHAGGAEAVYGLNTGFGSLARHRIRPEQVREVQRNLVRSHAAGVGEPLRADTVRAMLVICAASLCRGHSGARVEVVQGILDLLARDVVPVVPSRGSVGASGDLAPLAHAALVLMGEGRATRGGREMDGAAALADAGLSPIRLESKEGLALINGTHLMAAMGVLGLADIDRLFDGAIAAASMAVDACRGTDTSLDDRVHVARGQVGQRHVAARIRAQLAGSEILDAHRQHDPRVQDPYSLRAVAQVLGAAHDTIEHVRTVFTRELGGVTDNPLIFPDAGGGGSIISGGNFHGMPLAIALDTLAIALCHVAGIAERRIYWLLAATDGENPVNIYLSPQPGLHSGLMIVQYTAAACCNELQTLATPASIANISTSAGMEDYNSFGATAALQVERAVGLARSVVACELLVMAEALEYQRPMRSGNGPERTHDLVRAVVPKLTEDRPPAPDIARIEELIRDGAFSG